jgi:hypothetical protein
VVTNPDNELMRKPVTEMMSATDPLIPDPERPLDPSSRLRELPRSQPVCPVHVRDDAETFLVSGYAEARAVLKDRQFGVDVRDPGFLSQLTPAPRSTRSRSPSSAATILSISDCAKP